MRFVLLALLCAHVSSFVVPAAAPRSSYSRSTAVTMGGPSGLPRMPIKAWPLTKRFNPGGQYDERIATLWRDLEITFNMDEDATFKAVKRVPSLMNPEESSRWVFFRSKDLLIKKLGSEQAAINLMAKDPSLLLCPQYDGLNPKLEAMLSAEDIASVKAGGSGPSPVVIIGGVATVGAAIVYIASNGGL